MRSTFREYGLPLLLGASLLLTASIRFGRPRRSESAGPEWSGSVCALLPFPPMDRMKQILRLRCAQKDGALGSVRVPYLIGLNLSREFCAHSA